MNRITKLLTALATASFVQLSAGCGQSGALYIPGDPSRIEVPPASEGPSDENEETDKEPATESAPQ
jgi:predicted small lipoprotein YifL